MFFIRPVSQSGLELSVGVQAVASGSAPFVMCGPIIWNAQPSAETWVAIYRLAYEQFASARLALRSFSGLEPSLN